jgi:hypothetical protein
MFNQCRPAETVEKYVGDVLTFRRRDRMKRQYFLVIESGLMIIFLAGSGFSPASAGAASVSSRLSTRASPAPAATPGGATTVTCAFSHPSYSGWCRVTRDLPSGATAGRLCSRVLSCLNNVRCTRTYCNATTIRGGWKLESVQTAAAK